MTGFAVVDFTAEGPKLQAGGHLANELLFLGFAADALKPHNELVAVERMAYQGIRTGKYVLETARVGGMLLGAAMTQGYKTWESTANAWRKQLLGVACPKDNVIRAYMEANVADWPTGRHNAKTTSHIADACGLAIIAARTHQKPLTPP